LSFLIKVKQPALLHRNIDGLQAFWRLESCIMTMAVLMVRLLSGIFWPKHQ